MIRTYLDGVQLPVNPLEDLTLRCQGNNQRIEVVDLGEVTKIGSPKLAGLEIRSLFTDNVYPFSALESAHDASWYVDMIRRRMDDRKPVRFVCTGDGIDINLLCSIESFQDKRAAGEPNESYYTLSLMEYREPVIKRIKTVKKKKVVKKTTTRKEKTPAAKTHAVKYGDTLWGLAKAYYGNGALYTKIYNANRDISDNPNEISVGQVYKIPP